VCYKAPQERAILSGLQPIEIAVVVVLIIFSLGAHEAAHAWTADRCGDDTGRMQGRVTLNPLPHIDPFGTILLPAMLLYLTNGAFVFGSARPVPVNMPRLRNGWRDMALVAAAGPVANIIVGIASALLLKIFISTGMFTLDQRIDELLLACLWANVFLAVFNLLPIPPLDGSRILTWLLPRNWRERYQSIGFLGIVITLLLLEFVPGFQYGLVFVGVGLARLIEWGTGLAGL
jgi:Zn-dependent protease